MSRYLSDGGMLEPIGQRSSSDKLSLFFFCVANTVLVLIVNQRDFQYSGL